MKIVSTRSDSEIAKRKAQDALSWPLRELTAALLRIARGAGKPTDLPRLLDKVTAAYEAYIKAADRLPADDVVRSILECDPPGNDDLIALEEDDIDFGVRLIRAGVLQQVASMLVRQPLQRASGEREIADGLRMWAQARESRQTAREKARHRTAKRSRAAKNKVIIL